MAYVPETKYVNTAGDTLVGDLNLNYSGSNKITVRSPNSTAYFYTGAVSGQQCGYSFQTGTVSRWNFTKESNAESTGNVGSDFSIGRFDDAGSWIDNSLYITRSTGYITIADDPVSTYGIATKQYTDSKPAGQYRPEDIGIKAWNYDPIAATNNTTLTSGVLYLSKIRINRGTSNNVVNKIDQGTTISNVLYSIQTLGTGVTVGLVGLYTSSGTLVASTPDQTTSWNTGGTTGPRSNAFTTPYVAVGGTYYIGLLCVASTATPAFNRGAGLLLVNGVQTGASARFSTNGSSLSALPSTITTSSNVAANTSLWFGVS